MYKQRVIKRFENSTPTDTNGLNTEFWNTVPQDLITDYYKTRVFTEELDAEILKYAKLSMTEADQRLNDFQKSFPDILVVAV